MSEDERAELARLEKALQDPKRHRIRQTLFMGKSRHLISTYYPNH